MIFCIMRTILRNLLFRKKRKELLIFIFYFDEKKFILLWASFKRKDFSLGGKDNTVNFKFLG